MKRKYNYENCYEEALKYHTMQDFRKNNPRFFNAALKYRWLWDFDWIKKDRQNNNYWDKEHCKEAALQCKTRRELHDKFGGAYHVALKNNWLDDYVWLSRDHLQKWFKDTCFKEAQKYQTRKDFQYGTPGAYHKARENGWLDDYVWLRNRMLDVYTGKIDSVYAYYFMDYHAVYVGRTIMTRQEDRDKDHVYDDKDAVVIFAKEHNIPSPPMVILEDNLTLEEGVRQEGYWVDFYKKEGWHVLNRAKAGSLGGLGRIKWPKGKCLEYASRCTTMAEFRKIENGKPYRAARNYGWIDEFDWLVEVKPQQKNCIKKENKQTVKDKKEECKAIAQMYSSPNQLKKHAHLFWKIIDKCRWMNEFYPNYKPQKKWDKKLVLECAKQCRVVREFQKKFPGAFSYANRHKLLENYFWLYEKPEIKWNKTSCFEEAKKYKSRSDFNNNCGSAYNVALENNWLNDYTWFETKWEKKWNKESCYDEAQKYEYKIDFMTSSSGAYEAAYKNGWFKEYNWLKSANGLNQHPNSQKPIVQLSKDMKIITKFDSCSDCPREYDPKYVTQCCTHEGKSAYGYLWMYEEVYYMIQSGKTWEESMDLFNPKKKEVLQFDLNGNFIKEWSSTEDVCNELHDKFSKRVAFCASHYGKTFKGYLWKWKIDVTDDDYIIKPEINSIREKARRICKQFEPVVQLSLNGVYIKTYTTREELQHELNRKCLKPIYNNCKGISNQSLGFKWKYEKDYIKEQNHEK